MKRKTTGLLLCAGMLTTSGWAADLVLETDEFRMRVDDRAVVRELADTTNNQDYLHPSEKAFFCQIRMYNSPERLVPKSFSWKASGDNYEVTIGFTGGISAQVEIQKKEHYVLCELKHISNLTDVEFFVWGPYYNTISQTVGTSAGVVRNKTFALGIRPMNYRTQGGSDAENKEEAQAKSGFLAIALEDGGGSRLGAYTKDRTRMQEVKYGNYLRTRADAIPGETVVGSKIAIYGTREPNVLDLLEGMIRAEGLPYPTWKGIWTKKSRQHTRPRLIVSYSEENVEECIEIGKAGSFAIIYHKAPYETKGTFMPRKDDFPNGWKGLKECADKIRAAGMEAGLHNLSTFMSPEDPYCSPVPSDDLSVQGVTTLGEDIGASDETIVLDPTTLPGVYEYHQEARKPIPKVIKIGEELIQYRSATATEPIRILDCQRGAWGTKASTHKRGDTVGRVLTHKYKVFFPNIKLLPEIAENLVRSLNLSGIRSISFDGLEGTRATGHGLFAQDLFTWTVWKNLEDKEFICSSSRLGDFFWYINSHQTWGEPHGEGFRHDRGYYEGKIAGRIQNVLIPNYIPFRLGQYQFRKLNTITDIEWLMTKCAGLGGGFDLYITPEEYAAAGEFGRQVMETIALWEEARLQDSFTPEQREEMIKFETVFRLDRTLDGTFKAVQLSAEEAREQVGVRKELPRGAASRKSKKARIDNEWFHKKLNGKTRILPDFLHHINHIEPGGESASLWKFESIYPEQPLQFVIRLAPGETGLIKTPVLVLNGVHEIRMDLELGPGQYISSAGDGTATLYREKGHKALATVKIPIVKLLPRKGKNKPENSLSFNHDRGAKGDLIGPDVLVNIRIHKPPKDSSKKKGKKK